MSKPGDVITEGMIVNADSEDGELSIESSCSTTHGLLTGSIFLIKFSSRPLYSCLLNFGIHSSQFVFDALDGLTFSNQEIM